MPQLKRFFICILAITLLPASMAGCLRAGGDTSRHNYTLAPLEGMPEEIKKAPLVVREAYQFASANPEVLKQLPCFCGCQSMNHTSNYSCYVQDGFDQGEIVYDKHALGCSICVDITRDAMRKLDEGKNLSEIRLFVDETYGKFGPSNMPDSQ